MDATWLFILTIITTFFNGLFLPKALIVFIKLKPKAHCHYWQIFLQIHICLIGFIISNFIMGICCILDYNKNRIVVLTFKIFNIIGTLTQQSMSALFLLLFVERVFATMKRNFYEKIKKLYLVYIGSMLCWIFGIWNVLAWNIWYDGSLMSRVAYIVDFITVICTLILWRINFKLKQIHSNSQIVLSNRYQIYENIRMLKYALPFLIIGTFAIIFGGIVSHWGSSKDKTGSLYYFWLINIWLPFIIGYEVVNDLLSQMTKLNKPKQMWQKRYRNSTKVTAITNNFNIHENNIDHHFLQLKNIWKN